MNINFSISWWQSDRVQSVEFQYAEYIFALISLTLRNLRRLRNLCFDTLRYPMVQGYILAGVRGL